MPELPTKQATAHSETGTTDAADKLLERLRAATRGEYDIYGELGRGGMASVYLAHEISLDRKVAIKVMSPAMVAGPGLVERFKREARTAAALSHPNIIPIYAVREVDDLLFCVIKLVQGTPLDAIMRELGTLPIPMVQAILAQVGDALGYAHRHGVVHRDVKPGNILIDDDGWAVVTDFGIAKVPELEGLTLTGVAVGTPTYMSPEQGTGSEVTGAADQYSLGVVAYEMLAGTPPFTGTSMMAVLYKHFHEAPPPLETLRPDCPPELRDAVMRMLSKDPDDRWPSLEAATAAMGAKPLARDDPTRSHLIMLARSGSSHRIVSQWRTPQSPIPRGRKPNESPARRRPRPLLLTAGAAVLLGVGYWIASFGTSSAPPHSDTVLKSSGTALRDSVSGDSTRVAVQPPAPTAPDSNAAASAAASKRSAQQAAPNAVAGRADRPQPVERREPTERPEQQPNSLATRPPKAESAVTAPADSPAIRAQVNPVPLNAAARPPNVSAPAVDEQGEVRSLILAFARALGASDLAAARRLYPGMPNEQREGFEALWKAGSTLTPQWTINDILVNGNIATARIRGSNVVRSARGAVSQLVVDLRARLERRGTEWRIVSLVN